MGVRGEVEVVVYDGGVGLGGGREGGGGGYQ